MSLTRIVLLACVPGFALGLGAVGLSQFALPEVDRYAESYKDSASGRAQNDQLVRGLWHRAGDSFVNLGQARGNELSDLRWFEFADNHELQLSGRAGQGRFQQDQWLLSSPQIAHNRGIRMSAEQPDAWCWTSRRRRCR